MAKGAIYTIGYAKLTPVRLREIMDLLRMDFLYDCRSSPRTRVAGFGPRQLETFFGPIYQWRGRTLGGRATVFKETLQALSNQAWAGARIMLMCVEESPGDCHRHHTIGAPLAAMGSNVLHVYRTEVIRAEDLQAAIDAQAEEYDCEDLFDHAAREVETARAQKGER
jgi:uncharacterized protein (DUF488 family)